MKQGIKMFPGYSSHKHSQNIYIGKTKPPECIRQDACRLTGRRAFAGMTRRLLIIDAELNY
jgi:hypothetical protein